MLIEIINLKDYTVAEHLTFALGCLLWVLVYIVVIKNIIKKQFIEIPILAVCANFCWEFLWSFVFTTNMGDLYVWGYRIWFFLDCYIVYGLFKYGSKQVNIEVIKKNFYPVLVGSFISWGIMLYYYISNYDFTFTHMGANSGYVLNVMMSAMYITLFARSAERTFFSVPAAWYKGVGTLLITFFCFLHFTDGFLLSMCVVTAVLDALYIYLCYRNK